MIIICNVASCHIAYLVAVTIYMLIFKMINVCLQSKPKHHKLLSIKHFVNSINASIKNNLRRSKVSTKHKIQSADFARAGNIDPKNSTVRNENAICPVHHSFMRSYVQEMYIIDSLLLLLRLYKLTM